MLSGDKHIPRVLIQYASIQDAEYGLLAQRLRLKGSHANIIRDLAAILRERLAVRFYHAPSSMAIVEALKSLEIKSKKKRAQSIMYRLRYRLRLVLDISWLVVQLWM